MYKVDLHTHSVASPDGSLTVADYRRALHDRRLDFIAVTDHNRIDFAQRLYAELGNAIIVGEEIATAEGEIIGLFLHSAIPAGLSLVETIARIRQQAGLVYVPHPLETRRKGVTAAALDACAADIDIVETHNGRAVFQNTTAAVEEWTRAHAKPGAAASDAHGWHGWGKTYSVLDRVPTVQTLAQTLQAARLVSASPGLRGVLYPKFNRLRKVFHV